MTMVKKARPAVHPAGEFKAHCLRLIDEVARTGVPIVVSKRGKPLVRVVPVASAELGLEEWRRRGRETLELPDADDTIVGPTGERWRAERSR
jgi:prevent-host-death family protein